MSHKLQCLHLSRLPRLQRCLRMKSVTNQPTKLRTGLGGGRDAIASKNCYNRDATASKIFDRDDDASKTLNYMTN